MISPLKEDSNGRFKAMWTKNVRSDIYFQILHIYRFQTKITKFHNFRKIEL